MRILSYPKTEAQPARLVNNNEACQERESIIMSLMQLGSALILRSPTRKIGSRG